MQEYKKARLIHDSEDKSTIAFIHKGITCVLHNHPKSGHWCGYVNIGTAHRWFAEAKREGHVEDAKVHGGITYAEQKLYFPNPVPYVKGDFWIGFDCSHNGDIRPLDPIGENPFATYRTREYSIRQTRNLAEQALSAGVE